MFRHTVRSDQIVINVPQKFAWQVLLDLHSYPEWNPFTYQVNTTLKIGDPVDLYVKLPKRGTRIQREYVKAVNAPEFLAWGMHMLAPWMLSALRTQNIEAIAQDQCRYYSNDHFNGLLTPIVAGLFGASIKSGFNSVAYALKQRAESLWKNQNES